MADLVPHPLVTSVGLQLAGGAVTFPKGVKSPRSSCRDRDG